MDHFKQVESLLNEGNLVVAEAEEQIKKEHLEKDCAARTAGTRRGPPQEIGGEHMFFKLLRGLVELTDTTTVLRSLFSWGNIRDLGRDDIFDAYQDRSRTTVNEVVSSWLPLLIYRRRTRQNSRSARSSCLTSCRAGWSGKMVI